MKHEPGHTHDPNKNRPRSPEKKKVDRELDEELEDSFPASDPPAITQPVPGEDKKKG